MISLFLLLLVLAACWVTVGRQSRARLFFRHHRKSGKPSPLSLSRVFAIRPALTGFFFQHVLFSLSVSVGLSSRAGAVQMLGENDQECPQWLASMAMYSGGGGGGGGRRPRGGKGGRNNFGARDFRKDGGGGGGACFVILLYKTAWSSCNSVMVCMRKLLPPFRRQVSRERRLWWFFPLVATS